MLVLWVDLYNGADRAQGRGGHCRHGVESGAGRGIAFILSGFTDKQPELLTAALSGLRLQPSEQALEQAMTVSCAGLRTASERCLSVNWDKPWRA